MLATRVSVHKAAIIVASARILQKCLRWRTKFDRLALCCGCVEGAKYPNGLLSRKRPSRLGLLRFIAAQEEQQTFLLLLVAAHICRVPAKKQLSGQAMESQQDGFLSSRPVG